MRITTGADKMTLTLGTLKNDPKKKGPRVRVKLSGNLTVRKGNDEEGKK